MNWKQQLARDRVVGSLCITARIRVEVAGEGFVLEAVAVRKRDIFYDDRAPSDLDRELRSMASEKWIDWVGDEPEINAKKYVFRYRRTQTPFLLEVTQGHELGG